MPKRSANISRISEFDMFEVEYWSLEQAKLGKSNEKALARQVASITGGGSGIGAATAQGHGGGRRGGRHPRPRPRQAAKAVAKTIGGKALAMPVRRHRSGKRCAPPSTRWWQRSAASISWSPMPARPGRAPSARSTTRSCARSFELNFFAHQSVAQTRGAHHAGAGHLRLPAVQHLQAGGQSGQGFRALWLAQGRDPVPGASNTRSTTARTASAPTP